MKKEAVLSFVKEKITEKLEVSKTAMLAAQESANNESKSSMGDKYETGRAMAQIDRDMYARQYDQNLQELQLLERIANSDIQNGLSEIVALGSLVETTLGYIFLSVSLGSIQYEGKTVLVVSVKSPIGKTLLSKRAGDHFIFQGKSYQVLQIVHN